MSYSKFSTKISDYLADELHYPDEKRVVLAYALDSLFIMVVGFIMIMAVGFILGVPGAAFFAILSGGMLRQLSGGFHFAAPLPCLVFGAIVYPVLSWAGVQSLSLWGERIVFVWVLISLCITSLLLVGILAPVDSLAKPIISQTFRKKLKYSALLWVLLCSIIAVLFRDIYIGVSLVSGLTFQSLTLLPFLNKIKK